MPEFERRREFEAALCEETYRSAWCYACRLCTAGGRANLADAEDLLQEALLRAYQRFEQLRDPLRFKGWLLSIVRTLHLDRFRRNGHPAGWSDGVLENVPATVSGGSEDPRGELMLAALSQLPWAQQELLSLFYLDGLNLNETGQALGLAPRVVRKRLFRARKALRRRSAALETGLTARNATPQAKEGSLP